MRSILVVALVLSSAAALRAQAVQPSESSRARVIATLEKLMITGEPRHTSHDEGQWLQAEVSAAVARGDAEITRLAHRAAIPLVASARTPVSPLGSDPPVIVEMPAVLTLPAPVTYRAQLFASVDGSEFVPVGTVSSTGGNGGLDWSSLESARKAGLHHIKLRARIVYQGSSLSAEMRDLPAVVYAIYDPEADTRLDARFYVALAKGVSARRLDAALPDVPFATWLDDVVAPYRGKKPVQEWRTSYCDELAVEAGLPPRTRDLCTVAYFTLTQGWGEIWLRTGRIEARGSDVQWLVETPAVEAIRLRHSDCSEVSDGLSALPNLLAAGPSSWPVADLSIAPEDISVTRTAAAVNITAVVRNSGNANSRGAELIVVVGTSATDRGITRSFVVDVPRGGTTQIELSMPFFAPYGAVVAQVMQISEHTPHDSWSPDRTPDDAFAFRIISPQHAPKGFAASLVEQCAPNCRGH